MQWPINPKENMLVQKVSYASRFRYGQYFHSVIEQDLRTLAEDIGPKLSH